MRQPAEKSLVLFLIAAALLFLFDGGSIVPVTRVVGETNEAATAAAAAAAGPTREKLIYTCRIGEEEKPAVRIFEMIEADGVTPSVTARVGIGAGIEVKARGAVPVWSHKAVAARSTGALIDIVYDPRGGRRGYDWLLTLRDAKTVLVERVKDCAEISDE